MMEAGFCRHPWSTTSRGVRAYNKGLTDQAAGMWVLEVDLIIASRSVLSLLWQMTPNFLAWAIPIDYVIFPEIRGLPWASQLSGPCTFLFQRLSGGIHFRVYFSACRVALGSLACGPTLPSSEPAVWHLSDHPSMVPSPSPSTAWRPGMQRNILQCTKQPPARQELPGLGPHVGGREALHREAISRRLPCIWKFENHVLWGCPQWEGGAEILSV